MVQPVPLNKRSKKAQREYHSKQRSSWVWARSDHPHCAQRESV